MSSSPYFIHCRPLGPGPHGGVHTHLMPAAASRLVKVVVVSAGTTKNWCWGRSKGGDACKQQLQGACPRNLHPKERSIRAVASDFVATQDSPFRCLKAEWNHPKVPELGPKKHRLSLGPRRTLARLFVAEAKPLGGAVLHFPRLTLGLSSFHQLSLINQILLHLAVDYPRAVALGRSGCEPSQSRDVAASRVELNVYSCRSHRVSLSLSQQLTQNPRGR